MSAIIPVLLDFSHRHISLVQTRQRNQLVGIVRHPQSLSVTPQSPYTARLHGHANAHIVDPCNCHERQLIMATNNEKSNLWLPKFAADVCSWLCISIRDTGAGPCPGHRNCHGVTFWCLSHWCHSDCDRTGSHQLDASDEPTPDSYAETGAVLASVM